MTWKEIRRVHCLVKTTLVWLAIVVCLCMFLLQRKLRMTVVKLEQRHRNSEFLREDGVCDLDTDAVEEYDSFRETYCRDAPILTLFTTASDDEHRKTIHQNTVQNWAALAPCVRPILFIQRYNQTHSPLVAFAKDHGWEILTYSRSVNGLPVLKDMFLQLEQLGNRRATFVGYANADILFDFGLIYTLHKLAKSSTNTVTLVSGIRTNSKITTVEKIPDLWCPETVNTVAQDYELCRGNSADYFIFSSATGFFWDRVPDFIPARPGYDSWFLGKAVLWGVFHVDVTGTVMALHQPSRVRPDYMRLPEDADGQYNIRAANPDDLTEMCTHRHVCRHACARHETDWAPEDCASPVCVELVGKSALPSDCKV